MANFRFVVYTCMLCLMPLALSAQPGAEESPPPHTKNGNSGLLSKLAQSTTDTEKIEAYKSLIIFYSTRNLDSANWYADQAIGYSRKKNYLLGEGIILAQQAVLDENQGRVDLGTERTNKAMAIYRELSNQRGVAEMLHNLGTIEASKGNYDIAAKHFVDALKVYDSVTDNHGLMLTYMNLGSLYMQQRDSANAWKYLRLAEKVAQKVPLSEASIFLYNTIGVLHAEYGDTKIAEKIFLDNLALSDSPQYINAHIETFVYIGEFYSENGEQAKASEYLTQGLDAARTYHLPEMEANILLELAKLQEKDNPAKAIEYLNQAKTLCLNIQSKAFLEKVYGEMAGVYKNEGNYKEALIATEEQQKLHDSLFNINQEKEIAKITSSYQLAKSDLKVSELQHLSSVNARERDIIIVIAVVALAMLCVLLFFFRRTKMLNRKMAIHEQELKELNSMKDKLFSVIGHDLRGPIARIPTILELYESENTTDEERKYLFDSLKEHTKVSLETFDKLLYWGRSLVKGVRLQQVKMKPKTLISESIALRRMRIAEKNITVTDTTPENLVVFADPALFDFIIRNLIANALKYTYHNGAIQISADTSSKPGFTIFSVSDNGVGMTGAVKARLFSSLKSTEGTDNEKGHGIGLMLCKEFAVLNGGDIWVESEPGKGSTFYFSVKNAV